MEWPSITEGVTKASKGFFEQIKGYIQSLAATAEERAVQHPPINARDYGAKGDGRRIAGVVSSATSPTIEVAAATFTAADVGKLAVVYNDTEAGTIGTIQSVTNTTTVVLSGNAGLTLNATKGVYFAYGTDNATAITAALAAAKSTTATAEGYNEPIGIGQGLVFIPADNTGEGLYMCGSQVTVPTGVMLDIQGMLGNMLTSRTTPVLLFSSYSSYRRVEVDCYFGAGVQLGATAGVQADIHGDRLILWQVGKSAAEGLVLAGTGYLLDLVWMKGGKRGVYMNAGSDCRINTAFLIGAVEPILLKASNQVHIAKLILDSCGIPEGEGSYNGVNLEEGCSDIDITVQAFEVTGVSPARKLTNVVAVGAVSSTNNVDLKIKVQAQLTGGVGLLLEHAQDVIFEVLASNTASASSGGSNMTAAVKYGTIAGSCIGVAAVNSSIKPYEGTLAGTLTYTRSGVKYVVCSGAAPGVAAATGAGTGAPSPKVEGNGQSGIVEWGTGTGVSTGAQVNVTFNDTTGYQTTPRIMVTALNQTTAEHIPYVSAPATTGFAVGLGKAPAESQGATTYRAAYAVVG